MRTLKPSPSLRLAQALHESSPETVPHPLPDEYRLAELISDLPLRLIQYLDLPDLYLAVLQVQLRVTPSLQAAVGEPSY